MMNLPIVLTSFPIMQCDRTDFYELQTAQLTVWPSVRNYTCRRRGGRNECIVNRPKTAGLYRPDAIVLMLRIILSYPLLLLPLMQLLM